jgi:hypothetical protein
MITLAGTRGDPVRILPCIGISPTVFEPGGNRMTMMFSLMPLGNICCLFNFFMAI